MIIYLSLGLLTIWFVYTKYKRTARSSSNLPPGPCAFPVVGHLPLLGSLPHKTLLKWKSTYGSIIYVRFGSLPTVVLNDVNLIKEAFSLKEFCGRARIKHFLEGCEGKGMGFIDGPAVYEQRQFVHKNLKRFGAGTKQAESELLIEISKFLHKLKQDSLTSPAGLLTVNDLFTTSILNSLWNVVIGSKFELGDPEVTHLIHLVDTALLMPTLLSKLAVFLPVFSTWFPNLSKYRAKVAALKDIYAYVEKHIAQRKLTWTSGRPRDLTDVYLDKSAETTDIHSTFHFKNGFQAKTTGELLMAGIDTTATTLEWFVWYIAKHPSIQEQLQKEIDDQIGSLPPSLNDRASMDFAQAVIYELLRMSSIAALGVFHRTLTDVSFHGYSIPADTMVLSNIYAVHHDKSVWGDPENFRPERFLDDSGKLLKNVDGLIPFSAGRRVCPGQEFARDQLFLYVISMLQMFDVSVEPGMSVEETLGIAVSPSTFQARFWERGRSFT